jgi:VWFA-related protein
MYRKLFCSSLILGSLLVSIVGQQPQQPPPQQSASKQQNPPRDDEQEVVRITTNLVQVDVVVTKDGKQVTDLTPEDFELFEDGRPQKITHFSYISNVPATTSNNAPAAAAKDKSAPIVPAAVHLNDTRRTVAFVVDDLGMSNESVTQTRRQLRKFVDEQLQPNDLVAIIRTGGTVGALQQFTNDKRVLHSAIEHLKWNYCSRTPLNVFPPTRSPYLIYTVGDLQGPCGEENGRNVLVSLNALRFAVRGMGALPGRKAMVIFSDSIPISTQDAGRNASQPGDRTSSSSGNGEGEGLNGSTSYEESLRRLAEMAIRSSVVLYAVDTRGLQYTGLTAADAPHLAQNQMLMLNQTVIESRSAILFSGREGSELMARQTGGFLVRNSNDFGIDRVMDDQRGYYLLGYRPSEQTFNRRFHQIKARVKQRGLTLRTRAGFFGVTEDEARPPELASRDKMNLALMSPFGGSDINLRLTTFFANEAPVGSLLRSFLYLDARDLTFTDNSDGTREATFALSSVVFGDNGKVLSQQDRNATLRLSQESYERAQREGIVYSFDMPVKGFGAFQFRVAVRDQTSARIGAAGQFVALPNLRKDRLALSGIVIHNDDKSQAQPSSLPLSKAPANDVGGDVSNGPAVRQFRQGSNLIAAFAVYKALLDKTTNLPRLTTQTRIFRDGKLIFTGDPTPLDVQGQPDLQRLIAGSRFYVGPELAPGDYVLQIIVEDHLGKEKSRIATQWIDFEVVK